MRRPLALLAGSMVLATMAGMNALANVGYSSKAISAFIGSNPNATNTRFDSLVSQGASFEILRRFKPQLLETVRTSALNAASLRALSMIAASNGHNGEARKLLDLAHKVSRRDILTELSLIESSVQTGDLRATTLYYDEALSTNYGIWSQLFPILQNAMDEPQIRDEVARFIAAGRSWTMPFLSYVVNSGRSPEPAALAILDARRGSRLVQLDELDAPMIRALAVARSYQTLSRYFLSISNAPKSALADISFNKETSNQQFAPITWAVSQDPDVEATIGTDDESKRSVLEFSVGSGKSAIIVEKIAFLPAGTYLMDTKAETTDVSAGAMAQISVTCNSALTQKLVWQSNNLANARVLDVRSKFVVDQSCPVAGFTLKAAGGDSQVGLAMRLQSLNLSKIN